MTQADPREARLRELTIRHAALLEEAAAVGRERRALLKAMKAAGYSARRMARISGMTSSRIGQILREPSRPGQRKM